MIENLYYEDTELPMSNTLDYCDELRAHLIQGLGSFAMGNMTEAFAFFSSGVAKAQAAQFFSNANDNTSIITGDDLMNWFRFLPVENLTKHEFHERFALMNMLIYVDTITSLSTGTELMINDSHFPDLNSIALNDFEPLRGQEIQTRRFGNFLALNTIWESNPFALMYDDQKELKSSMDSNHQQYSALQSYRACSLFREIIRFVRLNKDFLSPNQIQHQIMSLHMKILALVQICPNATLFADLSPFVTDQNLPSMAGYFSKTTTDTNHFIHLYLAMMSYLHLLAIQSFPDMIFPLLYGDRSLFSSKDVLFASIKALEVLSHASYTPIQPKESLFDIFGYDFQNLQEFLQQPLDATTPSPTLTCPSLALFSYLVCCCAIMGFRKSGGGGEQVRSSIVQCVAMETTYPCLMRMASVFPVAKIYAGRLLEISLGVGDF